MNKAPAAKPRGSVVVPWQVWDEGEQLCGQAGHWTDMTPGVPQSDWDGTVPLDPGRLLCKRKNLQW